MAWIKQRTAEYRITNNELQRVESLRSISFNKKIEHIPSTFDIHYSIFDIRFFRVSISIKLAAVQASGAAYMKHFKS